MPPMKTRGVSWNVGTDDFVLPALLAILIRIVSLGFTVGVLVFLFIGPNGCPEGTEDIPPFLYGSLFALAFLLTVVIINENLIFSTSIKGGIEYNQDHRYCVQYWLFIRIILFVVEFICVIICSIAVFGPAPYAAGALQCQAFHDGPLRFAAAVVIILLVTLLIYIIGFAIYLDPCGLCCSPSLIHDMGNVLEVAEKPADEVEGDEISAYAKNSRLGRLHRSHLGYGRIFKKLRGVLCCLNVNGNRSRTTALQEMSLALHTLFSNDNRVPSDLVAGLILLNKHQKKMRLANSSCPDRNEDDPKCLHYSIGLKEMTFAHLPDDHKPNDDENIPPTRTGKFDPDQAAERLLLEDLEHYMKYAMGIYGWPLHVFDNLCCGLCQLCTVTCCACKYKCCHPKTRVPEGQDFPDITKDDCCMSGLGTIRLRSDLPESQVLYISYENEVFQAPYSICADNKMKAIVLVVRGTLSIKDAMTDLSVSMEEAEDKYIDDEHVVKGKKKFVHIGMYTTAKKIYDEIEERRLLEREFAKDEYKYYQLVITGHSLGAGVASVLGVMLKHKYEDLECFVFSPPGCIFSYSLAEYSKSFTTAVILGNDMIPRVTYRSLLYLKRQMNHLIEKCKRGKFQVIFRPNIMDSLPRKVLHCLCGETEDPEMDVTVIETELRAKIKTQYSRGETIIREKQRKRSTHKKSFADVAKQMVDAKKAARVTKKWFKRTVKKKDSLHSFVEGVEDGELVAAFPPGKILHIQVDYSKKPWILHHCYPDKLSLYHMKGEDLCVIIVDRGMVDDHLPNNVLAALRRCRRELVGSKYDSTETALLRKEKIARIEKMKREKEQARLSQPKSDEVASSKTKRMWAGVKAKVTNEEVAASVEPFSREPDSRENHEGTGRTIEPFIIEVEKREANVGIDEVVLVMEEKESPPPETIISSV